MLDIVTAKLFSETAYSTRLRPHVNKYKKLFILKVTEIWKNFTRRVTLEKSNSDNMFYESEDHILTITYTFYNRKIDQVTLFLMVH